MKGLCYIVALILVSTLCFAAESYSTNFNVSSYFGSASLTFDNSSLGTGQVFIGNDSGVIYNIQQGIFYIMSSTQICSISYLNLCIDEASCTTAGGYWYDSLCHANPEQQGGGSGGGGGTISPPRFSLYPDRFNESLTNKQLKTATFFIENIEFSSPLRIEINTNFTISRTIFDIAPSRIASISFDISGLNKSGKYFDIIKVRVVKSSINYKDIVINVSYDVVNVTQINLVNTTKPRRNYTNYFDYSYFDGLQINQSTIQEYAEQDFLDKLLSSDMLFILCISLLVIIFTVTLSLINEEERDVPWFGGSAIFIFMAISIFFLFYPKALWWLFNNASGEIVFTISVSLLVIVMTILIAREKQEQGVEINWLTTIGTFFVAACVLFFVSMPRYFSAILNQLGELHVTAITLILLISSIIIVLIVLFAKRRR